MTSATYYRADSVRSENGGNGRIFGKFRGRVESTHVATQSSDEGWSYIVLGLWTGGLFHSEAEAMSQGIASLKSQNWSTDLESVKIEADRLAEIRHDEHCRDSAAYRKFYGPAKV